jgi:nucleoredoxin
MKLTHVLTIAAFAAFSQINAAPAATGSAAAAPAVVTTLKGDLVALEGKKARRFDDTKLADKKYIAVYFSAHWCAPCRAFTPKLVEWYNANKAANPHFELVFVSRDHSEKDMESYMEEAKMPWPALKFNKIKNNKSLNKHAANGIPHLVMLDATGNAVAKDMGEMEKVLKANPASGGTAAAK